MVKLFDRQVVIDIGYNPYGLEASSTRWVIGGDMSRPMQPVTVSTDIIRYKAKYTTEEAEPVSERFHNGQFVRTDGLYFTFNVNKDTSSFDNVASITIHNMNSETFSTIKGMIEKFESQVEAVNGFTGVDVQISAGYLSEGAPKGILFKGQIVGMTWSKSGSSTSVTIEAAEGIFARRNAVFSKSYAPGTTLNKFISDAVGSLENLGIDVASFTEVLSKIKVDDESPLVTAKLPGGATYHGLALHVLDKTLRKYGFKTYINNEALVVRPADMSYEDDERVPILTPISGLIAEPALTADGRVSVQSLLIPNLTIGSRFIVSSFPPEFTSYVFNNRALPHLESDELVPNPHMQRSFVIDKINYTGDSKTGNFVMNLEGI